MIKKILIANRGEIAVRVAKACREMGITSVAVYSDADKSSLHVRVVDEAYHIGSSVASESYLDGDKILALAKKISADAIHPGYGFLSENSQFIKKCEEANIIFIGPSSESVEMMGNKTRARTLMKQNNVPIVPGTTEGIKSYEDAEAISLEIGLPVMLKAASGGGGKGMRKIEKIEELKSAISAAQNEAKKSFGDDTVYIEKFVENPKHIEVQILADKHGNYIHLFERDCSVQRRHQKVVEEAPAPTLTYELRAKVTKAAIDAAKASNYYNAGTIEFLFDQKESFYFLEMNTRLQVEHPVTEVITGVDLVKEQIKIAQGDKLTIKQEDLKILGHAIECRIYAEDVDANFAPSTGKIKHHRLPSGPGIRVDRGIDIHSDASIYYDPMLSKVITSGSNREEALARMTRALGEYQIAGVTTNIYSFQWILNHPLFVDGHFDITFLDNKFINLLPGKWKKDLDKKYENVAAILSAILKEKDSKTKAFKRECKPENQWGKDNYE
ncbi:MAG: acetyl-CoA carboxylase biotin carboxylase subunit [Melioribacteraceae bacterium]|jgi:acetyl-CoA carboxylase biotin carboxylase subunit|nr:acetyl-CoA carboxylase biotin carboxylase subunit [Melioribacteraceae bacterium]